MDPRMTTVGQRQMHAPKILRDMQRAAADNRKLNLCPCGCPDTALNEHGYCEHLVGFTNDGRSYEPREFPAKDPKTPLESAILERVDGSKPLPVLPDDILVQITTTARVYRGAKVEQPVEPTQAEMLHMMKDMKEELRVLREENAAIKGKKKAA
jgi:hypothetical protein